MSIVKDMSLAPSGQRKIDWVRSFMPALSQIEARFAREKPFSGLRAAVSVHLEAKTANLALVLQEGGAKVYLTGCNPLSTQDDVAAAVAQRGVETFGLHGVTPEQYEDLYAKRSSATPTSSSTTAATWWGCSLGGAKSTPTASSAAVKRPLPASSVSGPGSRRVPCLSP